jgi:hypothetical protein
MNSTSMRMMMGAALGLVLIGQIAGAAADTTAARQASWRAAIARTPSPGKGCFQASYPLTVWKQVACTTAPARPYVPTLGRHHGAQQTGDGHDYAGVTKQITLDATGTFPKVSGLKSETGAGGRANAYSLQINSNFMSGNPACANSFDTSRCLSWLQYVYSSTSHAAFMQYWLIHYTGGSVHCPAGWNTFSDDCYRNSNAVSVPLQPITELPNIILKGAAVAGGTDTLTMTTATQAYTVGGQDSVVFLATSWHESEWNIIGDGGGSSANFNPGTKLTVRIDLNDGTTKKPKCRDEAGTTGETNNLTRGKCSAKGGDHPYIQFKETIPKA